MKNTTPKQQLDGFLAKYEPGMAAQARQALTRMRRLVPGAIELVYDNYNALVIGFSPTERPSDAIFSLAIMPRWVTLCFLQGVGLPDPRRLLRGSGNQVRHVRLTGPDHLEDPAILELIDRALERAKVPLEPGAKRKMIIRSISAKQRPRRP